MTTHPEKLERWRQFSLSSLLLVVALVAVTVGWWMAARQAAIAKARAERHELQLDNARR